jgi:hypothetical protein
MAMDYQGIILASTAFVGTGTAIGLIARKLLPNRPVTVKWSDNPADVFARYAGLPQDDPAIVAARELCNEAVMPEQKGFTIEGFRNPIRAIIAILRAQRIDFDEVSFRQAADRCIVQIENGYTILKNTTPHQAIQDLAERANVVIHSGPDGKVRCYEAEDFHRLHPAAIFSSGGVAKDSTFYLSTPNGQEYDDPHRQFARDLAKRMIDETSEPRHVGFHPTFGARYEPGIVDTHLGEVTSVEDGPLLTPPPPNLGGEGNPPYQGPHYEAPEDYPTAVPYDMLRDPLPGAAVRPLKDGEK